MPFRAKEKGVGIWPFKGEKNQFFARWEVQMFGNKYSKQTQ